VKQSKKETQTMEIHLIKRYPKVKFKTIKKLAGKIIFHRERPLLTVFFNYADVFFAKTSEN
jgi:hypothetical protein